MWSFWWRVWSRCLKKDLQKDGCEISWTTDLPSGFYLSIHWPGGIIKVTQCVMNCLQCFGLLAVTVDCYCAEGTVVWTDCVDCGWCSYWNGKTQNWTVKVVNGKGCCIYRRRGVARGRCEKCRSPGRHLPRGWKINISNENFDIRRTTVFGLFSQTKGNAANCFISSFISR